MGAGDPRVLPAAHTEASEDCSMKALFYDTETTGLPLFHEPSEDPRQPHIVQIGAVLVDLDTRKQLASIDLTVRPHDWLIPDDVAKIHGITTEQALDVGVAELIALEAFTALWLRSDVRIGHNEQFDARIVRIGLHRFANEIHATNAEEWRAGRAECTQQLATPILKLPPTDKMRAVGRTHHKSANLREAYKHFYGSDLQNAHSAMADAQACQYVYFAIKKPAAAIPAAAAGVHA
jgi:DNA polymerase III subunit epsilon